MKDLNLIPKSYIEQKKKKRKKILLSLGILAGIVLLLSVVLLPLSISMKTKTTRDLLELEVLASKGDANTLAQMNEVKALYDAREKESAGIVKRDLKVTKLFEKVEKASPKKMFVTSLSYSAESAGDLVLNLSGIASSQDEIATFISTLRKDEMVDNIMINSIKNQGTPEIITSDKSGEAKVLNSKATDEGYTFAVNIYLKN